MDDMEASVMMRRVIPLMRVRCHEARRWTRTVVLATHLVLLAPTAVQARGTLKRSTPAAGAHLGTMPRELRLLFTEAPALAFTRVKLHGNGCCRSRR